jgi:protease secretion system outer membrane protein
MRHTKGFWGALALGLACTAGNALDLSQAYRAALEQDATINAARAGAAAGRENVPQARAQLLPSVALGFSRNSNRLETSNPNSLGQIANSATNYPSRNDSATIRQPIYRKAQWAQYQQALAQADDVEAGLDAELQNVAVKVVAAYFDVLSALDQRNLIGAQLEIYRLNLDAARKAFAAGSGTRTDIDEAQARLDMSQAQVLEATQNVELTRQQLQSMTGMTADALAGLNPVKLQLQLPVPNDVSAWIERAQESSPELRALRARVAAASLEVDKANAGHYPTLDAVAQWSRSVSENTQALESGQETRSIGLQASFPIFSGGSVNSAVRQALANKTRAEQLLEVGRRDLGLRIYREYRGITEGILRVRALEQAVKSAEQALLSSSKSFQAGSRTRMDVLNAENARTTALRDLGQARLSYIIAHVRLKAIVNDAGMDTIDAINTWFQD